MLYIDLKRIFEYLGKLILIPLHLPWFYYSTFGDTMMHVYLIFILVILDRNNLSLYMYITQISFLWRQRIVKLLKWCLYFISDQSFKETIVVAITGIVAYLILIAIVWVLRRQNHIERSSYGDKKTTQKLGNDKLRFMEISGLIY